VSTQQDGVPKGYHIFHFEGNSYREKYKAAGMDPGYQMRIESPAGSMSEDEVNDTRLLVNVFNGSEKSVVRFQVNDGEWFGMERLDGERSPFFEKLYADFNRSATPTNHIWSAQLPALSRGIHKITGWTRDMYSQEFRQTKVIEVF
jgi:hypothetical protein